MRQAVIVEFVPQRPQEIDLHAGTAPWAWLQPLLGYPWMTGLLNVSYHLWFFLFYATLYWLAQDTRRPLLRMQFLLSFVLSWIILGSIAAMLFSSVGPCYYGHLHDSDPYAPLMAYLHEANQHFPIWALSVQDTLCKTTRAGVLRANWASRPCPACMSPPPC